VIVIIISRGWRWRRSAFATITHHHHFLHHAW
jgi:hypothetical protein